MISVQTEMICMAIFEKSHFFADFLNGSHFESLLGRLLFTQTYYGMMTVREQKNQLRANRFASKVFFDKIRLAIICIDLKMSSFIKQCFVRWPF